MIALTLEHLRTEGERFTEEVARESFLAQAGHKAEAELEPIYARHAAVTGRESLDLTLDYFRAAKPESSARRSARLLLEWQVEVNVSRALVALDEREIAWESRAMIESGDSQRLPYQRAPIAIANSADRDERQAIDAARAKLAGEEHGPLRQERIGREREIVESYQIADDYVSTFELLSAVDLQQLAQQCAAFLDATQAAWNDVLPYYLKRCLGLSAGTPTRADALRLFRLAEFDAAFPAAGLTPAVRRHVTEMGLDADAGGRIVYDLDEREGKRARAFCAPVRVPHEVYLVLRPFGGQTDYTTLLHELGHALHFASADDALPFEFRWLGDNSVTETYAMLFDHRMHDSGWLRRYTAMSGDTLAEFRRVMAFEELHFIRRYCAKLLYERDVYGNELRWDSVADAYVERLTGATGFLYRREDAFVDLDPGFYSTRYLRAWQLQAVLVEELTQRFNDDWWRNPSAGPWLAGDLLSRGQQDTADDIASVLGKTLGFEPLQRSIERGLTA